MRDNTGKTFIVLISILIGFELFAAGVELTLHQFISMIGSLLVVAVWVVLFIMILSRELDDAHHEGIHEGLAEGFEQGLNQASEIDKLAKSFFEKQESKKPISKRKVAVKSDPKTEKVRVRTKIRLIGGNVVRPTLYT